MRAQLLSDIHFEFHRDGGRSFVASLDPSDVDVLVLAGDVGTAKILPNALQMLCDRYPEVIFIPGNHEYYGSSPERVGVVLAEIAQRTPNLHILQRTVVELGGVRFAGASLWFRPDPLNVCYQGQMSDFHAIKEFDPWVYAQNQLDEQFLHAQMSAPTPPHVLVTHYLPTHRAVSQQWVGSALNRFFVAPVAEELARLPSWWFYGHTHDAGQFAWQGCQFVCNPFGYPREPKQGFQDKLVLDITPSAVDRV